MQLVDTHCHFDDARFDSDRERIYQRAQAAGIVMQVVPAVSQARWPNLRTLCQQYAGLHPAYGLHPMFMQQHSNSDIDALDHLLESEYAVAVGECGLDFYLDDHDRQRQLELFEAQLALAHKYRLPVIVHARKAVEEVINLLRRHPGLRGVLHSFSGSEQQALRLFGMGFLVSFGGPITYPRAKRLQRLCASLPLEAIMLESDAPDQPDIDIRGERNEPARLGRILAAMATLRRTDEAVIARQTSANAAQLFGLRLPPS